MRAFLGLVVVACLALTFGTAAARPDGPQGYLVYSNPNPGHLWVSQHLIVVRKADDKYIVIDPNLFSAITSGIEGPDGKGFVTAKPLPPGDYEAVRVDAQMAYHRANPHLRVPFTIVADQVTYIGELRPNTHYYKGFLGAKQPGLLTYDISDERQRDMQLLAPKLPKDIPVVSAVPATW